MGCDPSRQRQLKSIPPGYSAHHTIADNEGAMAFNLEQALENVRTEKAIEQERLRKSEQERRAKKKDFADSCAAFFRNGKKQILIEVTENTVVLNAQEQ